MANEKRLINVNDVYSLFDKSGFARLHVADIDTIPRVDAVEVVRCRDCKHWHKETLFCDYMPYGEAQERVNWYANDFCSYGERKDNE